MEVAVTLVLLAILAAIGYSGFAAVRGRTQGVSAGPILTVAQLEARRLSSANGGFPASVLTDLSALSDASLSFTDAASTSAGMVSVYRVDEEALVLATASSDDCLVLLDRPFASSTWAVFRGKASECVAGDLAAAAAGLAPGGSASLPQEVTGG
ncbi:MAG: hypothetical protein KJS90_04715 [Acidobacteria bacterium]|nr:hypothetical protein [Acidobacteriota bacterium]